MKIIAAIILFIVWMPFANVKSQDSKGYPEIGKPCPDFVVADVENYHSKKISLDDFKGQYLILDFWTSGCMACVSAFPKMNEMQAKFDEKIKIVLFGKLEKSRDMRSFYKKYKEKSHLNLTSIYDSIYFDKLVHFATPHVIWVNKEGIIKAITRSDDVTEDKIQKFINNQSFDYYDDSYLGQRKLPEVDIKMPLLINGNGGADTNYLFRSILSKWEWGTGKDLSSYYTVDHSRFQVIKANFDLLLRYAYIGSIGDADRLGFYSFPIFNVEDTTGFHRLYNYSVEVPKQNNVDLAKELLMTTMQNDLKSYFGYKVEVIIKKMSVFKLITLDSVKVKEALVDSGKFTEVMHVEAKENYIKHIPLKHLPLKLSYNLPYQFHTYAYDDTGVIGNISIDITGPIDDYENVRKNLKRYGLDLIISQKEFKVLKVSEPKIKNAKVNL